MACGIVAPENNKTQRSRISILATRSVQSILLPRDLYRHSLVVGIAVVLASLFMFKKLARDR